MKTAESFTVAQISQQHANEILAARTLVKHAIYGAKMAYESALYWQSIDTDITRDCMLEYHVHIAVAYALNEALKAGLDVYTLTHEF